MSSPKILGPDGLAPSAERVAIDSQAAELTHKIIMIYLRHNFSDQCALCDCVGCADVRDRLGARSDSHDA